MNSTIIRVLLADDHTLVRAGFRALLDDTPDIKVVAETADGAEVPHLISETSPDVVSLDIAMPGNGLEIASRIAVDFPKVKILILSMHVSDAYVRRAFQAGAAGYLVKDSAAGDFEASVRAVMRGEVYMSPAVSRLMVERARRPEGHLSITTSGLTDRQRDVLRRIALGQTTKAIASDLGLSAKTVEAHRTQIMRRLAIHDIAGLVRFAIREGLVDADL